MSEKRGITEIVADLSRPRPEYVKTKTLKGNTISFFEWHSVVRILDEYAPGWHSEVKQVLSEAGKIAIIVRICVPCAEGLVWREAVGNEDDDASGYGDPFSNAEAMAFKRAAAKFGVGLYLYSRSGAQAPERAAPRPAPQQPASAPTSRPEPSGSLCSPQSVKTIQNLLRATGRQAAEVTGHYKVEQLGDLTERQAELTIQRLKAIEAEKRAIPEYDQPESNEIYAGLERPNIEGAVTR